MILTGAFVAMMCFFGMSNVNAQQEFDIVEHCTIDQFQDSESLHGRGIGESRKQQIARDKARASAVQELGENIEMNLKALAMFYGGSKMVNDEELATEVSKKMSKRIVNKIISNIKTVCEKGVTFTNPKGVKMYKYYQMVAWDKAKFEKEAYEQLKEEGLITADEDFNNFQQVFDKEFQDNPEAPIE